MLSDEVRSQVVMCGLDFEQLTASRLYPPIQIPLNRLTNIAVYIHGLTKVTSPKHCGSATLHSPLILCRPVIDRCPVFGILTLNPSSLTCFPCSGFWGFSCLLHGFPLSAREVIYAWILAIWETEDGRIRRYFFLSPRCIWSVIFFTDFADSAYVSHITHFTHWHSGFFWLSYKYERMNLSKRAMTDMTMRIHQLYHAWKWWRHTSICLFCRLIGRIVKMHMQNQHQHTTLR